MECFFGDGSVEVFSIIPLHILTHFLNQETVLYCSEDLGSLPSCNDVFTEGTHV